jgi:hypothetical protein
VSGDVRNLVDFGDGEVVELHVPKEVISKHGGVFGFYADPQTLGKFLNGNDMSEFSTVLEQDDKNTVREMRV